MELYFKTAAILTKCQYSQTKLLKFTFHTYEWIYLIQNKDGEYNGLTNLEISIYGVRDSTINYLDRVKLKGEESKAESAEKSESRTLIDNIKYSTPTNDRIMVYMNYKLFTFGGRPLLKPEENKS